MSANGVTVLPKSQSEDAFLLQKKRIPLEAQRISNIVESCISQVETAASLPAILQFCEALVVVDTDLNKALQVHRKLVERVDKLEDLMPEPDEKLKDENEERKSMRAQLGKDIKNSVRDVLRGFKGNPSAPFDLREKLALEMGESECTLIKVLKMFHSHIVERFLTSQERNLSKKLSLSPSNSLELLILKEEQIASTLKQKDEKISELDSEIKSLQSSMKEDLIEEIDRPSRPHRRDQRNKKPSMKLISLQQEIDQLTIQLNNFRLENGEAERTLREKNEMLEMETEYLLVKFDGKMKEIQAKLEENESAYEREQEELRKLEKPFSVLEVEFNQIQEKRQLAEEKRIQEMRDLELKSKAAIIIQAWWRGYRTRKALKNKGKNKKTKKGKGKKSR